MNEIFKLIRLWAKERGLYKTGTPETQCLKLQEEVGELAKAIIEGDDEKAVDAIGDSVVVLTNLAHLKGYDIEYCIRAAYEEIKDRKGKMSNGTFIREKEDGE